MRHVITGANVATDPWPITAGNTAPQLSARERDSKMKRKNQVGCLLNCPGKMNVDVNPCNIFIVMQ